MNGICSLVKPVIESRSKNDTLKNLLQSCVDQRAFSKVEILSVIGVINASLNASATRLDGLILLQALLPQCPQEVLCKHASSWMQFCLKGMGAAQTAHISFVVFRLLVQSASTVPELAKHVSSIGVPNLAEQIHQGIPPQANLTAFECLEKCMEKFNGSCGPHKKVFERFALSMIDYSGPLQLKVMWKAARCVALLPQVGGGGVGGAVYKAAWSAQQKSLCRSIHIILDKLFADSNEVEVTVMGGKLEGTSPLPLEAINDADPVLRTQKLTTRLVGLSSCLQAMMVMAYPVPKNVSASSILNLVCRGLAVNGTSANIRHTTHGLALAADLPKIHWSLLKLLESLIVLGQANLLPFGGLICKLVVQTLKWTRVNDWPYGSERPYRMLRIQAYQILKTWCGIAKSGSYAADNAQQIVELAMSDIYSEKDAVLLTVVNQSKRGKQSKKKGNVSLTNSKILSNDGLAVNETANAEVCVAALQAVTALVMAASFKIQSSLHKTLQETVVTVLLQAMNKSGDCPIPYSEPAPRLELYRLLLQLVIDGHPVWPAPTNLAIKLFANGLHDSDAQINMFCGMAQSCVEKIIHPAYPSLNLLSDIKDLEDGIDKSERRSAHTSNNQLDNNAEDSGDEITDAVSMSVTNEKQKVSNRTSPSTLSAAIPSNNLSLVNGTPVNQNSLSFSQFRSPSKSASSTPFVNTSTERKSINEVDSSMKKMELSNESGKSQSESNEILLSPMQTRSGRILKASPPSIEKEAVSCSDANIRECESSQVSLVSGDNPRNPIDLTTSDKSDDEDEEEIAEIPCEIDLADSDDDKVSLCSQDTVSTPVTQKLNNGLKVAEKPSLLESDPKRKSTEEDECDIHSAPTQSSTEVSNNVEKKGSESKTASPQLVCDGGRPSPGVNKRPSEAEESSSPKKQKVTDEISFDDDIDEEAMLLSFVDVTREEEEGGDEDFEAEVVENAN